MFCIGLLDDSFTESRIPFLSIKGIGTNERPLPIRQASVSVRETLDKLITLFFIYFVTRVI